MPSLSESISCAFELESAFAKLLAAVCLLLSAFCVFKAGAPSNFPVRRSRVKLQASDAVETKMMLASANQRFEGARICRGSSIAAYYYVVEGSPSTRMLSRLRQVNHCYLLVSTPMGYVDFLSRGSMLSCATCHWFRGGLSPAIDHRAVARS